ncbi:MAG: LysM peptidoglycan-binding domain-containing protein [Cryobacterium sp.]
MSTRASRLFGTAAEIGDRRLRDLSAGVRRGLFRSLPLVVIGAIAVSLGVASPADAATIAKKPLKSPSPTPETGSPTDASAFRHAPQGASAATSSAAAKAAPLKYVVVDGDTVSGIGGRFGLSTASVLALNGLGWSALIFPGQVLTLTSHAAPRAKAPAQRPAASEIIRYKIRTGDTISGIAASHGLSTSAVLSANGLGRSSLIFPGQSLVLPSHAGTAPAGKVGAAKPRIKPQTAPAQAPGFSTHTIAAGETISAVAAAADVPVQAILDANGLGWSSIIYPGQVLNIPTITALTAEMRANAAIIVSVGRAAGASEHGIVIALAAAAQESGLRNVRYGDRDSLGLFQQRPSAGWGSAAQVMDPIRASRAFFGGRDNPNPHITRGLLDIPGWQTMSVTEAAQAVQVSAYPTHYAKWEASARAWAAALG